MLRILQQFILSTIFAVFASHASAMFIQADWFDPTDPGVGTNRYAYSHNDPVNLSDPTGNRVGDLSVRCSTCDYYDHAEGANGTPSFGDYSRHPEAEAFIEDTYDFIGDVSGINGAGDTISSAVSGDVGGVVMGVVEIAIGKVRAAGRIAEPVYDRVRDAFPSAPVGRRTPIGMDGADAPVPAGAGRHTPELVNPDFQRGQNIAGTVNGQSYTGHAFDQMQNRGLVPSVVENTIRNGQRTFDPVRNTTTIIDPVNNTGVVINSSGSVITAW